MCYQVIFGRTASKGICINRREPPKLECWDRFLAVGTCLTPRNTPLHARVTLPNLVVLRQTVLALLRRSVCKIVPLAFRLLRPLKIIGTDTDPSVTSDSLLTFRSNHELSRIVSEINADFGQKSPSSPPCI